MNLQTPQQHAYGQQSLGEQGKLAEVFHGPNGCEAGADIVQSGGYGRRSAHHIHPLCKQSQHCHEVNDQIQDNEGSYPVKGFLRNSLAARRWKPLLMILKESTKRMTLMPPAVEPAQEPINISSIRIILLKSGHRSKFVEE